MTDENFGDQLQTDSSVDQNDSAISDELDIFQKAIELIDYTVESSDSDRQKHELHVTEQQSKEKKIFNFFS